MRKLSLTTRILIRKAIKIIAITCTELPKACAYAINH